MDEIQEFNKKINQFLPSSLHLCYITFSFMKNNQKGKERKEDLSVGEEILETLFSRAIDYLSADYLIDSLGLKKVKKVKQWCYKSALDTVCFRYFPNCIL